MLWQHPTVWILFSLILTACGHLTPVVYSEFANIGEDGMLSNWAYTFYPVPFDSTDINTGQFDLILLVRYTNRCTSKSVILDVESFSATQSTPDSLRVEIPLFDSEGTPLGKGNFGMFETADTIASGIYIPDGYTISLSSPLPDEKTSGVIDVGVKLSRTGKKELNLFKILHLE